MPFRPRPVSPAATLATAAALAGSLAFALPAHAQSSPVPPPPAGWTEAAPIPQPAPMGYNQGYTDRAAWDQARADWLAECRHNHGNGNLVGGALVGGVVGGLLGNAVAGHGDKTLGTVAGAAAGAVAGGAIGHGADQRRARDYCEAYLERHMSQSYGYGYGQPGYTYAYQPMTVMVPVAMVPAQTAAQPQPARECTETQVIEEWVPVAAPARRYIPRRAAPAAKRIRVVPDKRVPID